MEDFLSPISCRRDFSHYNLPWVPRDGLKQLLIKGGATKKSPEGRLKGTEKFIKRLPKFKIKGVEFLHIL